MSKITTDDCKIFIVKTLKEQGIETVEKEWKRVSKYKEGNLIKRDFTHPSVGVIVVSEDTSGLSIVESSKVKTKTSNNNYIQKDFTLEEEIEAAELVEKYIDCTQNDEGGVEKLMESDKWVKFQHALPSQFYFCFPNDTYENDVDNVTNGLDTPMVINDSSSNSFCIMFTDKNDSDIDLYASNILNYGLLPEWTDFCDEYHLAFKHEAPEITVREWFKMLLEMGFEYRDDDCLFAKELKKIKIVKSFEVNKEKDECLKKDSTLKPGFK